MLEGWTDDAAPALGPMGNPLKAGVLDTQARSWAEYGPKTGAWRLLDVLGKAGVKAVFYCSGILAERYPDLMRAIVDEGHVLGAHAWAQNIVPAYQSRDEEAHDLRRTLDGLEKASGQRPSGWISPRATPSANTPELLVEAGMAWYADAFDQDLPYLAATPKGDIVAVPFTTEVNDVPLCLRYGNEPEVYTRILQRIFRGWPPLGKPHGCLDLVTHAHVFGRPSGAIEFLNALAIAKACDFAWLTTHAELARLYRPNVC
jgi:hypothetical protein